MKFGKFYSGHLKTKVQQVNKVTAEKMFNQGETVYIQSCNMTFDNMWQPPYAICKESDVTFSSKVNSYTCYNCDNQRGKYPCFFIEKK